MNKASAARQQAYGRGPLLLVSVRNAAEALEALRGGADWIDLKEPSRGALGAVEATVAEAAVAAIAGRAPMSAALGELADWPSAGGRALLAARGVAVVKLGLAGLQNGAWIDRWRSVQREAASAGKELAAVAYVDHERAASPPLDDVVSLAADSGCRWLLLDTFDKSEGYLGDYLPSLAVPSLAGLRTVSADLAVAGRLDAGAISRLAGDAVDVIAVRSAACEDGRRDAAVCARRVAALRELLAVPGRRNARDFAGSAEFS